MSPEVRQSALVSTAMAADCVIAFSFGNRRVDHAIVPGPVNIALAEYVIASLNGAPKILQWEIDTAYGALVDHDEDSVSIDRNTSRPGRYLDTRNIAEQAHRVMEDHQWKTAAVVAHADHLPRAVACCRKVGIEVVSVPAPLPTDYDARSGQIWTRSRWLFKAHEVIANALYKALRYQ